MRQIAQTPEPNETEMYLTEPRIAINIKAAIDKTSTFTSIPARDNILISAINRLLHRLEPKPEEL